MTATTIGYLIAFGAVAVMIFLIFVKSNLIICPPNEVLIFSGRKRRLDDGSVVGFRVIRGGRGFRIPLIESTSRMSLNTMPIEVTLKKALSAGMIPVTLEGIANVKIAGTEQEGLFNAIERFLGRNLYEVSEVAKEVIEGSVRGVLSTMSPEEANAKRLELAIGHVNHGLRGAASDADERVVRDLAAALGAPMAVLRPVTA